jgi:signal transduction histidine kinase
VRRSFVWLVVTSVVACWVLGLVVLALYVRNLVWTEEKARSAGVFFVHELLDDLEPDQRATRLTELRPNFSVGLSVVSLDEVERRLGRRIEPGERVHHEVSAREEWYFIAFADERGALAAGPVNPAIPTSGTTPIGMILAIIGLPLIAGLIALRVERELSKVERASQALAEGEFGTRVDNRSGPSHELATSFNAMADRVERLIRSRDELVQAVSHELGSPLSRLRFHMELLESQTDQQREERLNAMTRELDALDDLVAELLGYVQSDDVELDRQVFDPEQGLMDLAELAQLEAPDDRSVEVRVAVASSTRVDADPRLFQRANENILRNAVRHARGHVQVELGEGEDGIRVTVHDDGPGIPEDLRERVVAPFVRLEADRDRKTGGVGLGLAIVCRILHRHDGRLEIASSPLGGAAMTTVWPNRA